LLTGWGVILFFIATVSASQYLWPTNASKTLTAVFGDVRPRRYHAGLDIRTYGKNGYEIYAVEDGYVQRVRAGSSGYGKAIYLKLDDGNTAVYAHLEDYYPELNQAVIQLQEKNDRYRLDHYFKENEFQVQKGQVLGHTGDTGSLNGPHLHFEIRDADENPINPLTTNLHITDGSYPSAKALEVLPLEAGARVGAAVVPRLYTPLRESTTTYKISEPIEVYGEIGLAVKISDRIDAQPFQYSIYRLTLDVDGERVYSLAYDNYTWEEDPLVYSERDFRLWHHLRQGKFHHLYTVPASTGLSFVSPESNGRLNLSPGNHEILIRAADINGNEISLSGTLKVMTSLPEPVQMPSALAGPAPQVSLATEQLEHGIIFTFALEEEGPLPPAMWLNGREYRLQPGVEENTAQTVLPVSVLQSNNLVFPAWLGGEKESGQEFYLKGVLAIPGKPFELTDGPVGLHGDGGTFYDTVFVRISKDAIADTAEAETPHPFKRGPVFLAGPENIPFKNEMELSLKIPAAVDREHAGIFYRDPSKDVWVYLRTQRVNDTTLTTTILSAEHFAVISETVPPEISGLVPVPGATYHSTELTEISFKVKDNLAGLDGERAVRASLDGKSLLLEYNSYREECRYLIREPLAPGKHTLHIEAADYLGNTVSTDPIFYLK